MDITDVDKAAQFVKSTTKDDLKGALLVARARGRQTDTQYNSILKGLLTAYFGDGSKGITIYHCEDDDDPEDFEELKK